MASLRASSWLVLTVAVSGVLLAPLGYLAVASGVCLRSPLLVEIVTLGFLEYGFCGFLHLTLLPLLLSIVGSLHTIAAAELLYQRLRGDYWGRVAANIFRVIAYVFAAHMLTLVFIWYVS